MNRTLHDKVASIYNVEKDFDYCNTKLAARIIMPFCEGKTVMEIGSADGVMTEDLIHAARSLSVVEPAKRYCRKISRKFTNVTVHNCYLEELDNATTYEVVVMASLLHHIEYPSAFLETVKRFLTDDSVVLATVPNMTSLHRRIGVKAHILKDVYGDTERNIKFHQFGRFDKPSFEKLFRKCGYEIVESFGYMLKPFSSEQMLRLKLDWNVINALFELGRENEHLASQLFIRARLAPN
jgi:2-polyprenyl-3-methyl-5-hydroxy-6-metoxy-1,4-benzoquinol methylase